MKASEVRLSGIGLLSPWGHSLQALHRYLQSSQPKFSEITDLGYEILGAQIRELPQHPLVNRKIHKLVTRKDLIAILSACFAVDDAGIDLLSLDTERFGCFVGTSSSQVGDFLPYFSTALSCVSHDRMSFDSSHFGAHSLTEINPLLALKTLSNSALAHISQLTQARGPNANFMDYELSGLKAIEAAYLSICEGSADICLAGVSHAPFDPFQIADHAYPHDAKEAGSTLETPLLSEMGLFFVLESAEFFHKRRAKNHYASVELCDPKLARSHRDFISAPRTRELRNLLGCTGEVEALMELLLCLANRTPDHATEELWCTNRNKQSMSVQLNFSGAKPATEYF